MISRCLRMGRRRKCRASFNVLGELLEQYKLGGNKAGIPFTGGAVGYFSYDLGHFIEKLPANAVDDLNLPECYLGFL